MEKGGIYWQNINVDVKYLECEGYYALNRIHMNIQWLKKEELHFKTIMREFG